MDDAGKLLLRLGWRKMPVAMKAFLTGLVFFALAGVSCQQEKDWFVAPRLCPIERIYVDTRPGFTHVGERKRFSVVPRFREIGRCVYEDSSPENVTWSVSDPASVSISNARDLTWGEATCLRAADGVMIRAEIPGGISASFPMDCLAREHKEP